MMPARARCRGPDGAQLRVRRPVRQARSAPRCWSRQRPIARDRSWACVLLMDEALSEEPLQQCCEVGFRKFGAHFEAPWVKR